MVQRYRDEVDWLNDELEQEMKTVLVLFVLLDICVTVGTQSARKGGSETAPRAASLTEMGGDSYP